MVQKQCNWELEAAKAQAMDIDSLLFTIKDCTSTAALWRKGDVANGTDMEGYYMDVASCYHFEYKRRLGIPAGQPSGIGATLS